MRAGRGVLKRYSTVLSVLTQLLDAGFCIVGGLLAYAIRFKLDHSLIPVRYSELMLLGALLVFLVFSASGIYQSWRSQSMFAPVTRALTVWVMVFLLIMVFLVVVKHAEHFSRLWLGFWFVCTGVLLAAFRVAVYLFLRMGRRHGFNRRSVLVIGNGTQARDLIRAVRQAAWTGFEVKAVFSPDNRNGALEGVAQQPLAGLTQYVQAQPADEIWITLPLEQSAMLREILTQLRYCTANIRYAPDLLGMFLLNRGMTQIMDVPMIDLSASPMQGLNQLLKSLEDRVLALVILVLLSPLMILIAVLIKLDSHGPVLFKQRRHGWNGHEIIVYKFRTMKVHSEPAGSVIQASPGDPRLTRVGSWLRRTSLDELPQLINVLQGRMSLVGPRPHAVEHNEIYKSLIERYMWRHRVKPGITGWAQVNGFRGPTETVDKMQRRVEYDFYYIENWSLWFDLKIIFLTLIRGFVNKNAY